MIRSPCARVLIIAPHTCAHTRFIDEQPCVLIMFFFFFRIFRRRLDVFNVHNRLNGLDPNRGVSVFQTIHLCAGFGSWSRDNGKGGMTHTHFAVCTRLCATRVHHMCMCHITLQILARTHTHTNANHNMGVVLHIILVYYICT